MSAIIVKRALRADAADLTAANVANQSHHLPWISSFTDMAGFDNWFQRTLTGPNIGLIGRESASNRIVGVVNLNEIIAGAFQSAYLGYYGMSEFSRTGLMTQVMREAIRFAFEDLGLHRLEANIQPENTASLALVRRLGFSKEGYSPQYLRVDGAWRDHERWAMRANRPH